MLLEPNPCQESVIERSEVEDECEDCVDLKRKAELDRCTDRWKDY